MYHRLCDHSVACQRNRLAGGSIATMQSNLRVVLSSHEELRQRIDSREKWRGTYPRRIEASSRHANDSVKDDEKNLEAGKGNAKNQNLLKRNNKSRRNYSGGVFSGEGLVPGLGPIEQGIVLQKQAGLRHRFVHCPSGGELWLFFFDADRIILRRQFLCVPRLGLDPLLREGKFPNSSPGLCLVGGVDECQRFFLEGAGVLHCCVLLVVSSRHK